MTTTTTTNNRSATSESTAQPLVVIHDHTPAQRASRQGRPRRLLGWVASHKASIAILVPVLVILVVIQGQGMVGAPQRSDDEGTYVSQAWAVLHLNTLAHYTYWYDHPPLGWILMAGYAAVTGAFTRAQHAVAGGREFMLLVQVVSAGLLYVLARRLELRRLAAAGAVLLFSLSPLAVSLHRAVYLDNIATTFVLASFVLALSPRGRLAAHAASGACFGLAVLCKETSLLLLPALVWQLWQSCDPRTRRYSLSVAGSALVLTGCFYLLFALLRGELLPGPGHVSLAEGVTWQLFARKVSGSPLDPSSDSHKTIVSWLEWDPWLVVAGVALLPVALLLRRTRPVAAGLGILVAMVARPGYLPGPFVIAVLPFAALVIAAVANAAWGPGWLDRNRLADGGWRRWSVVVVRTARKGIVAAAVAAAIILVGPAWWSTNRDLMTVDHDRPTRQAERWIEANVPRESPILIEDSIWVDLVRTGRPPTRVVWFWKLKRGDPEIDARYPNGWRDMDYVVSTAAVRGSARDLPEVAAALREGTVVASFGEGGDQVQVLRVNGRAPDPAASRGRP